MISQMLQKYPSTSSFFFKTLFLFNLFVSVKEREREGRRERETERERGFMKEN